MSSALFTELKKFHSESAKTSQSDYVFDIVDGVHSHNWIRRELIKTAAACGVPNLSSVHALRHTFASLLVMQGVDLPTVSKLLGHSDIQTTMIYSHLAADHLAKAVEKIPFK